MRINIIPAMIILALMAASASGAAPHADEAAEKHPAAVHDQAQPAADSHQEPSGEESAEHEKPVVDKILPSDVRVLIDISGSMKKTDPQNLRKPALNLIARLLPDKSRAGIWTFGQSVNMLMPHNLVDAAWRKQAAPKSEQISSIAYFTNIGKALEEVSFDREKLSADYKTHIILLTDGVVDISKEPADNARERERILLDLLPELKKAGYTIHTIALSADADQDLLKKLSVATDGAFTTALSADELTSTFLKIFDQAVPAERVPLEDNGFLVDASIKEFTALIFRKEGVKNSIIVSPEGKEYSATSPQDGINWYRTDKYDLITADAPKVGKWQIKTEITPQSRVTVVSNLQLLVQPLKTNLRLNDSLAIDYSFLENGKTITNKDFLGLLEVSAIIAKENTEDNSTLNLTLPSPPENGLYQQNLGTYKEDGNYTAHLYIDGKTFKREFKHSFSVIESVIKVSKNNIAGADGSITHNYKITVDEKLVDPSKLKVTTTIKDSLKNSSNKQLNIIEGNHWEFSFLPARPAEYFISIRAQGDMLDGSKLDETVSAETFNYQERVVEKVAAPETPVAEEKHQEQEEAKPEAAANHWLLYLGIGVGNLLIVVAGYFGYRALKGKSSLADAEKTLAKANRPEAGAASERVAPAATAIDLSDDNPAHIPMNDDLLSESTFPLDNMDDTKDDPNG